jgi:hypothetical protein
VVRWKVVPMRSIASQRIVLLIALIAVGLVTLILTCVFILPQRIYPNLTEAALANVKDAKDRVQIRESRLKLQNDARTTLLQGVGGLLVLIGASAGVAVSLREISLGREGQITERFTRAIDQIGSERVEVRVGGLFALERIVKNSVPDRKAIGEVLATFVNSRLPWEEKEDGEEIDAAPLPPGRTPKGILYARAPDVHAAMTVLGRGGFHLDYQEKKEGIILLNVDLGTAFLPDLVYDFFAVAHCNLNNASFEDCSFRKANFIDCNLRGVRLRNANLEGAVFDGVNLEYAKLAGTNLKDAEFENTKLNNASADAETQWPEGFDPKAAGVRVL